jgi:hypothetical protein
MSDFNQWTVPTNFSPTLKKVKGEVPVSTPWRRMGEQRYSSTVLDLKRRQLHNPSVLTRAKNPRYLLDNWLSRPTSRSGSCEDKCLLLLPGIEIQPSSPCNCSPISTFRKNPFCGSTVITPTRESWYRAVALYARMRSWRLQISA